MIANSYHNGEVCTDPIRREKHCEAITYALNPLNQVITDDRKKRKAVKIVIISIVSAVLLFVLVYFSLYGVAYSKYKEATDISRAYGCDLYLPAADNFSDLINEFNNEIAPSLKRTDTNSVTLEEWKAAEAFLENLKNKSAHINKDVEAYAIIVHNQVRCARICKQMFYWFS
jgi:predicted PurR-regulated permease PerM